VSPRALLAGVALLSLAAVGAALVSQHHFGMWPCPWCVLQRLIFLLITIAAVIGALLPARPAQLGAALAIDALAAAGMAAALWQHFVAADAHTCVQTLADKILSGLKLDALLPSVFAPWASCKDAAVTMLGIPYEFYSLALFLVIGIAMAGCLLGLQRRPVATRA
jgi:protein dithiol:quinone oxidoreductase